jgi:hypothetical protein
MAKMVLKDRHCLGPMDRTKTELAMHKNKHQTVWETDGGNSYEFCAIYEGRSESNRTTYTRKKRQLLKL